MEGYNEVAAPRSLVTMEVDLRSPDSSQRTLHWFVDDRQQPVSIIGLPTRIEFAV